MGDNTSEGGWGQRGGIIQLWEGGDGGGGNNITEGGRWWGIIQQKEGECGG